MYLRRGRGVDVLLGNHRHDAMTVFTPRVSRKRVATENSQNEGSANKPPDLIFMGLVSLVLEDRDLGMTRRLISPTCEDYNDVTIYFER